MEFAVILPLVLKMGCAAMVVVLASLAVERVGPVIGALIATLPVAGGPAYIFLAMEHGPHFIAESTVAGFPSLIGQAFYQVAYVHIAQRRGTAVSLLASLSAWLCTVLLVRATGWGFAVLAPLAFIGFAGAHLWVRRHIAWSAGAVPTRRWFDLPLRAGAVMTVAGSVILLGRFAGPNLAGLVAMTPTVFTSLIVILQPRIGGRNTAAVVGSGLIGMVGFTGGLTFLHLTAVPLGNVLALSGALGVCVAWNVSLLAHQRWRSRAR
jgi:uncharacterized membrane protein (GlpM family)